MEISGIAWKIEIMYKETMADFKTIDNLGVETSQRYAHEQEEEITLIKDTVAISSKSRIDISKPAYTSAFDDLLGMRQKSRSWSYFGPPKGFERAPFRLFSNHLIPAIRSDEFILVEADRIKNKRDKEKEKRKKQTMSYDWEERIKEDEEEKESTILLNFFDKLASNDKNLCEINSRRGQNQKG